MNDLFDTIAAIATPPGAGGIGIVRLSGREAFEIASRVFRANSGEALRDFKGFTARLGKVYAADGALIDEAIALVFHAPRSYTGEDAVELMCHGGEQPCAAALEAVCAAGASRASRGEFTRRAFLNGRVSLDEAEAVCELINSACAQGERAAAALATGALAKKISEFKREITSLQAELTACLDFPEEDASEVDASALKTRLEALAGELRALTGSFALGADLIRGVPAAIVGSPNVGKSTLLNLLAGAPKALVTPIAGTTRDVVEQRVTLGGAALLLADTAGIRDSDDPVEKLGVERALERAKTASLLFAVFDSSRALGGDDRRLIELLRSRRAIAVINKTDLESKLDAREIEREFDNVIYISANDPASLAALNSAVARAVKTDSLDPDAPLLATERQRACAERALEAASQAASACELSTPDVVFALLAETLEALGELTGENVSETVLDEVFARFCVGK